MRRIKAIFIIALAALLVPTAQNVWAAHKLVRERSGRFDMQPTAAAGPATARIRSITVAQDRNFFDDSGNDDDFDDDFDDDHDDDADHGSLGSEQDQARIGKVRTDNDTLTHGEVAGHIIVNGLEDPERVEAFLVDNEGGRSIKLGNLTDSGVEQLELRFSVSAENVQDFDSVVLTREPPEDPDPNPSSEALFQAVLPHE